MASSQQVPLGTQLLLAAASNCAAACVTNPLDVIKVKLQLDGELAPGATKRYSGFIGGVATILRQEGIPGLYKGLVPSLLRESTYSAMRLGFYEPFKSVFGQSDSLLVKIAASASSGCIAAAIANPTDLLKVRLQAVAGKAPATFSQAVSRIYSHEGGIAGFWQGVGPNVARAGLLTAAQISTYDEVKNSIKKAGVRYGIASSARAGTPTPVAVAGGMQGGMAAAVPVAAAPHWAVIFVEEGLMLQTISAMAAGFVSALVTSPVDTAKTRIMNQRAKIAASGVASGELLYRSVADCVIKTAQAEGPRALYKGFVPQFVRLGPHTLITFLVYEQLRALVGMRPV